MPLEESGGLRRAGLENVKVFLACFFGKIGPGIEGIRRGDE